MNITLHEWQNAQAALHERRRQVVVRGSASSKGRQPAAIEAFNPITQNFFRQATEAPLHPVAETSEGLTEEEIRQAQELFGLKTFAGLKTDHMTPAAAESYTELLRRIREWRQENVRGQAYLLCCKGYGAGKTHIAKAVMDSFARIYWTGERPQFYGGEPVAGVTLERHGLILTARQCMEMVGDTEKKETGWRDEIRARKLRIMVLDDIGREGTLPFIQQDRKEKKAEEQAQIIEKQARYFEFFNFCYEEKIKLFITSNLLWDELRKFLNGATWSRLEEMAPRGCVYELFNVPDYRLLMSGRQAAKG